MRYLRIGFFGGFAKRLLVRLALLLLGQNDRMVHDDAAIERLAYVDVVLIVVVVIKTCDNHYYDEEDIDIGKPVSCKVVVNHTVELTEEEKAEARRNAIRKAESEAYAKLAKAKSKPKKIEDNKLMPSLF